MPHTGLLRKITPADAIVGLSIETIILFPVALSYLAYLGVYHQMTLLTADWTTCLLLVASGIITTVPLLCFGQAARTVPLSMLGFMQFTRAEHAVHSGRYGAGRSADYREILQLCAASGLDWRSTRSIRGGQGGQAQTDEFVQEQVVESAGRRTVIPAFARIASASIAPLN